jgi:hypothetical protein
VRRFLVLAFVALAACRREAPPRQQPAAEAGAATRDDDERASLTNIARGATIVSRTGEAFLGVAADAVIDGDPTTFWLNPPRDLPQSIVIALPARARIDRVGLRTPKIEFTANHVQFETSLDGIAWRPLTNVTAAAKAAAQWFDVTPVEASWLRVTIVDGRQPEVRLQSVLARGAELEPPRIGAIDGCWSLNGRPATFTQRGDRVLGVVSIGNEPMFLDGGGDGRVYRFVWIRGNDYGLALMTVSPDGKHLTALEWHEEAIPLFRGEPWFGERAPCGALHPRQDVALALLRRVGRYSSFGGHLPKLGVPARIIVHEFREATPEKNKQRAQREIERLRAAGLNDVTFVAAGSDAPRQEPATEPMRLMYSAVDLEIRR